MFICVECNFETSKKSHYARHCETKKHAQNSKKNKSITCPNCEKIFKSLSGGYYKHIKLCDEKHKHILHNVNNVNNVNTETDLNNNHLHNNHLHNNILLSELKHKLDIEHLTHQLEIEKLKNIIQQKDNDNKYLHLETLIKQLQPIKNEQNISQNIQQINYGNISIANNTYINKKYTLNMYFKNVIDIDTFTDNYKNGYGLTQQETQVLLDTCELSGVKACASNICYFLKRSYKDQYENIYGRTPKPDEIVLPFCVADSGLRQHYEKNDKGWAPTTSSEKLKKFIVISNDHVYKHHNKFLPITLNDRLYISNAMLRSNNYNNLITNKKKIAIKNSNNIEIDEDKNENNQNNKTKTENQISFEAEEYEEEDDEEDD